MPLSENWDIQIFYYHVGESCSSQIFETQYTGSVILLQLTTFSFGNDEKHDKIIQEKKMKEKSSGKEMSRMT